MARASEHLGAGRFCLTYADGVADIDLRSLTAFHEGHGGAASVTVVRPRNPCGVAERAASVVPDAKIVYMVRDPIDRIVLPLFHRVGQGAERRR